VAEEFRDIAGDAAHRVARRVWALAEEWGPALAEVVAERHDLPTAVCQDLARLALAYVGVAALLGAAHEEEEPNCPLPGHPYACVTEATLERAMAKMPERLNGSPLEVAYRDLLREALSLWQARVAPQASTRSCPPAVLLSARHAPATVGDLLPD
jgi:hypothetical protein